MYEMKPINWFAGYIALCLFALVLELFHTLGYSNPLIHTAVHDVMFPFITAFGGAFLLCWGVHAFVTTQNTAIVEEDAPEDEI